MRQTLRLAFLGAAAAIVAPASATVIAFSNFGSSPAFSTTADYSLTDGVTIVGLQFVSLATGLTSDITIAMNRPISEPGSPFSVALYTDSGGTIGLPLGSWSSTSTTFQWNSSSASTVDVPAPGALLLSGLTYWLVATNPSSLKGAQTDWNQANNTSANTTKIFSSGATGTSYSTGIGGASSISVLSPTPEPLPIAGLALGGLLLLRRRR